MLGEALGKSPIFRPLGYDGRVNDPLANALDAWRDVDQAAESAERLLRRAWTAFHAGGRNAPGHEMQDLAATLRTMERRALERAVGLGREACVVRQTESARSRAARLVRALRQV